jgi:hypothetical protein
MCILLTLLGVRLRTNANDILLSMLIGQALMMRLALT